jgi:hypothetical protein
MQATGNLNDNTTTRRTDATLGCSYQSDDSIAGRARRSQARALRYRQSGGRYLHEVRGRIKAFCRGTDKYKRKICPSRSEILLAAAKEADAVESSVTTALAFDPKFDSPLREERAAVQELIQATANDSRGFIPATKPPDTLCLFLGNMNSMSLYDQSCSWKDYLAKRDYQTESDRWNVTPRD